MDRTLGDVGLGDVGLGGGGVAKCNYPKERGREGEGERGKR